jgi:hypothetical protein
MINYSIAKDRLLKIFEQKSKHATGLMVYVI